MPYARVATHGFSIASASSSTLGRPSLPAESHGVTWGHMGSHGVTCGSTLGRPSLPAGQREQEGWHVGRG
eukprot:1450248-Prymnesium_polylepis.1